MSAGGVVLVIIDGISDVSIPVLHGKTPLTACRLPVLNRLAAAGQCGLMDPVSPGLACGSDTAHLALFGYEPRSLYRGRGAFEAIGDGIDMLPGDIAFKCNFAWMDVATGIVQRRCADSSKSFSDTASYLCSQLDGINLPGFPDVAVNVKHAMKHRCCVRLRAAAGSLCDRVSDTDPLVDGEVLKVAAAKDPADALAVRTAAVVNAASVALQDRLAAIYASDSRFANVAGQQSANLVLLRGASEAIQVDTPFPHLHGLLAFLIAPTKIIAGVGRAVGLPVLQVAGATGDYRTSFSNKASACVAAMLACRDQDQALSRPKQKAREWLYDLGIVHIKAVDDAGHHGNLSRKLKHLEDVDNMVREIADGLLEGGRDRVRLLVTGDHTTPVCFKEHSCEPVLCVVAPVSYIGSAPSGTRRDGEWIADDVMSFDEADVGKHGSMGRFKGLELMKIIKHHVASSS